MTEKQIAKEIRTLKRLYDELDKRLDAAGIVHYSKMGDAIWELFEHTAKQTAKIIGDKEGWLSWYMWDNLWGKKKLTCEIGKRKIVCDTPEKLATIITWKGGAK